MNIYKLSTRTQKHTYNIYMYRFKYTCACIYTHLCFYRFESINNKRQQCQQSYKHLYYCVHLDNYVCMHVLYTKHTNVRVTQPLQPIRLQWFKYFIDICV